MKHIPGAILAVIVFAWVTFLGVGIALGQMDAAAADSYLADVCKEISESSYDPAVVNACGTQAKDSGYDVTIVMYSETGTKTTSSYADGADHTPPQDDYVMATVQLKYNYQIKALGIDKEHVIRSTVQ